MQQDTYVIGDVQGCFESLTGLLEQIDPAARIVFVGDLINRGPDSLKCLRLIRGMCDNGRCLGTVLGNHDLHLLAVAAGAGKLHRKDSISDILEAPDAGELIDWMRTRPLLIETDEAVFVHAGIPPAWSLKKARAYAREVEAVLAGDGWKDALAEMYGNDFNPESKNAGERLRAILNGFTRMRYLDRNGRPDFGPKMAPREASKGAVPWFEFKRRVKKTICFGHWSTLGLLVRNDLVAVDTGCLWGGSLTAVRLSDRRIFSEPCPQWAAPSC